MTTGDWVSATSHVWHYTITVTRDVSCGEILSGDPISIPASDVGHHSGDEEM